MVRPQENSNPYKVTKADVDSSQTHCKSSDLGGCPWLVLACLACAALFRAPKPPKTCRGLESFFFPLLPSHPNTTPKETFKPWHGGISGL